ncbi:PAC2 family-domain-containing protein [Gigaspora margarita]|uniref:Proteasome assembly chaperone 2 n=1 Tax=Gigaspora margarita TaxID=4874 RepID=A0A8H4AC41_GIGMA|nr:PAC2 family-domain-containing protein [Gigaspora margarita]
MKFIPVKERENSCKITGSTLILPAISIGNVPQLAVDLLITTLNLQRIGFLEDENVIPVAGVNEHLTRGITVAIEVYQSDDNKWTVIQQRATVIKKKWHNFAENLLAFIKQSQFSKVILLSSADATRRVDIQLTSLPLRILTTPSFPNDLSERATILGLKTLEKISNDNYALKQDSDLPKIPGGGISRFLFHKSQREDIPLIMIIFFAIEGDNTQDAFLLANYTNSLLNLLPQQEIPITKLWKTPASWNYLFGNPYQQELYQ